MSFVLLRNLNAAEYFYIVNIAPQLYLSSACQNLLLIRRTVGSNLHNTQT